MSRTSRPQREARVAFIFVTLLLDTLGIGLVVPVLPELVRGFLGGDLAAASRYYGAFIAVYAAMQFVFAPILGGLSDRFGRRRVLLASLFGAALDYLLLALAPGLAWLFVGRVLAGITGASFSTATAYIADVTPPEKRAQSFGLVGAAFGLGFIVGPALGGFLGGMHLRAPFFVAAGLNLANFLYGLLVLPESLPAEKRRSFSFGRANPLASLVNLRRHPMALGLTGTLVCAYLAQQILQTCWALHGQQRYGWTATQVGVSLTVVGGLSAIVQGGLVRGIVRRLGERRALVVAALVNAAGYVGFTFADRAWMAYAIMVPFSLGGIAGPAVQALITRGVGPSEQGELQGSLGSLLSIAAVVGPLVGTGLLARFGPPAAVPHLPGAPFLAAGMLHLFGLAMALRLFARVPEGPASGAAAGA
jgi:DHA1 family tetracycline resistance protein-like MFS transporter